MRSRSSRLGSEAAELSASKAWLDRATTAFVFGVGAANRAVPDWAVYLHRHGAWKWLKAAHVRRLLTDKELQGALSSVRKLGGDEAGVLFVRSVFAVVSLRDLRRGPREGQQG